MNKSITPQNNSASDVIKDLAAGYDVGPFPQESDGWSNSLTRLNGDDVSDPDEIEMLLINLRRVCFDDGVLLTKLHAQYLKEKHD